jgi:cell division septum initiation protein DivIVA
MLAEARALWSADPNPGESAEQALSILAQINPGASCYNQAQSLMKQIQARAKQVSDRQYADEKAQIAHERQMEVRRLNAAASLEKARINACRDVAVAYCKSRPRVVYRTTVINRWW